MKKFITAMAIVAALFVAGNVQAQNMVYVGYAPESFTLNNSTSNYQGFTVGFSKNMSISNGFGVAIGADFRMNTKSGDALFGYGTGNSTQTLIDVPILFNYGIGINRDFAITPFVGPMLSLALTGNTKVSALGASVNHNWYGDNSTRNRFNLYAVLGADLRFSQFNLFGGYRWGLLDLDKGDYTTLKANGMFIGVGFEF